MIKKIVMILMCCLYGLPVYAYDAEALTSDVANIRAIQEGSTESVYFIHVFDGMWPIPQRFILTPQEKQDDVFYIYTDNQPIYADQIRLETIDDPYKIGKMKQYAIMFVNDAKENSAQIGWEEFKKENLNIFRVEFKESNSSHLLLWRDQADEVLFMNLPDDLWQASLETFLACRKVQCTPFHLKSKD